jgi:hypothetical protein
MRNGESIKIDKMAGSLQQASLSGASVFESSSVVATRRAYSEPKPINLSQRIKKLLGITNWSEMLEGDQEYFGF